MKIIILGNENERRAWTAVFNSQPDVIVSEFDPVQGLQGYKETEVTVRLETMIRETAPDAVCVAAERKYRAPLSIKAIDSGCHVLSVPPVADTPEERTAIAAAAERTGKIFMAAHESVFRPGILRCISTIYRGAIGPLQSIEVFVHVPEKFKQCLMNIEHDAQAYRYLEETICGYLCVLNKITKAEPATISVDESRSEYPNRISINLNYGGTPARVCFLQSRDELGSVAEDFVRSGAALSTEEKLVAEMLVNGDNGFINYSLLTGREFLSISARGRKSRAEFPHEDSYASAAKLFIEFTSRGIPAFVDARAAAGAEEAARICLDQFLKTYYVHINRLALYSSVPDFWNNLETVKENTAIVKKLVSADDYTKRFTWDFGGEFNMLLLEPPRDCLYSARQKQFGSLALPTLAGVLALHGCAVETDDLNRLLLRPDVFSQDEIEKLWGRKHTGDKPADQDLLRAAAAKAADDLPLSRMNLIGFSFQEYCDIDFTLALCREIKKRCTARIVFGGPVSVDPARIGDCADFAIRDDGELPLLCLIKHISGDWPIESIPGLSYPPSEKNLGLNFLYDIRVRGVPAYNTESMKLYSQNGITLYPYLFVNGCPHKCAFCSGCFTGNPGILEINTVIEQLQQIHDNTGAQHFFFLNNLLNTTKKYLNYFLDGILSLDFKLLWSDSACLYGVDQATAEKMHGAGCRKITWGLDAATDRLLKLQNKPIRMDDAESILHIAHKAGIRNEVNFIIGLPHETPEDHEQILRFVEKNSKIISKINCAPYYYATGSPLYYEIGKHGVVKKGNSFDETGGLKWEAKLEYISNVYEKTEKFFIDFNSDCPSEFEMME